jgi:hypothetical protein
MFFSRVVLATFIAALCAGCGTGHDDSTLPSPSTGASTSPTQTPSRDTVPAYLKAYSVKQRKAYGAALSAQDAFDRRNARILAAGKTTKAASVFYHRYSIDWVSDWSSLAQLANNHVTVTGQTKVRWARPISIRLPGSGTSVVVLRRCVDQSHVVVSQNGSQLPQPELKRPRIYRVRLEQRNGEEWWRSGVAKKGSPC